MVRKIFNFLHGETKTLNQAAFLLGLFALLSNILAFLRDRLLAHNFGASTELDIYYAAFRIPDFIFVAVASVVSLSVLIPFIIEKREEGSESLRRFLDSVLTFFVLIMTATSALAFFFMPLLSEFLFGGFSEEALAQVVFLSRLLLVSPIILGLSNLFGSLTQAYSRFAIYAAAPLLYNVGIITGIIFLSGPLGVTGVVAGVLFGAVLHALIQVPFLVSGGLLPKLTWCPDFALIGKIVAVSVPRSLAISMTSISLVFLASMASLLATGSISILSFSWNIQAVPVSIIGVSYSLAAFSILSRRFQEKNITAFIEQMAASARFIIFWSLPLTALVIILRAQIVRTILGSGLFDWDATRLVAASLALFTISAVFQSLLLLFIRGFYSAGLTNRPLYINLVSTSFMLALTWWLVKFYEASESFRQWIGSLLKVSDLDGAVLMLPLGFSLAAVLNAVLHWIFFEKEFRGFSRLVARTFLESLGAMLVAGLAAYLGLIFFAGFLNTTSLVGIFLQGALAGLLGIGAAALFLFVVGSRELIEVWAAFKSRFWKTRVMWEYDQ